MTIQSDPKRSARSRRLRRALSRGLTLVELIIVITIIGSLMGIIAFAIFQRKASADKEMAALACKQFRQAVLTYKSRNPEAECVTPDQLKTEKEIDSTTSIKDPWGHPYTIKCDGEEITVCSDGPNKNDPTGQICVPSQQKK